MISRKSSKAKTRNNVKEEYYQISPEILSSFSKYRPPVDLFKFTEAISTLEPYSRKGQRISNAQVEELQKLCEEGILFVSRSDHSIYSEHIVMQLDLVLQDANLKEGEIANICNKALTLKFENFMQQPLRANYDILYKDLMVFTEFIAQDKHRIKLFIRRINREYSLVNHSLNCLSIGLWLWMETTPEYRREDLNKVAIALFLHDMGMCKVPPFIIAKKGSLTLEEREKINGHPIVGYNIFKKINVNFSELSKATVEHHERANGEGYPRKLKGDEISKIGRITALVDSFSTMISTSMHSRPKQIIQAAGELLNDRARYDTTLAAKLYAAFSSDTFGDITNILQD